MRDVLLFAVFASALCGQDADSHYQRARDLIKTPEKIDRAALDQATDELNRALRLRPDFLLARIEMGRVQVLRREYDAAVASATEVLRADPKNLEAQLVRASALVGMGKAGVARLFLQDTLAQYPDHPDVLFNIASAGMADGRFPEAEETFRKLWKLEPSNVRGLRGIAITFISREEKPKALEVVQAEAAKLPGRKDVRTLVGEVAQDAGKYDVAVDAFRWVVQNSDKPAALDLARLGESYRLNGDLDSAIEYLRKASVAAPGETRFLAALASTLATAGKRKDSEQAYREAVAIEPKHPVLLNNLAWLIADSGGDLKEALGLAQRARDVLPLNSEITDTIGWIYLKSNMAAEAAELFERLTVLDSNNPTFRYHFALALAGKGEKDRALREAKRALADGPAKNDLPNVRELIQKLEGTKP